MRLGLYTILIFFSISIGYAQNNNKNKYYPNLWDEISSNYSLKEYKHKDLKWHIKWFVDNPAYLTRVTKRANKYLYLVNYLVKKYNMPAEIALLPIVESAYYPFAYSHGTASGLWQFIPSTGKLYGLNLSFWVDDRRDVLKSTKSALKYLANLKKLFNNDWYLAIAAYNSGPGRVQRAIAKNRKLGKPTDFWHLELPAETIGYVPRLLAVAELIKNPKKYNQKITKVENKSIIGGVQLNSQLDLALIADWSDLSIKDIYELNPALNQWATPKGSYYLLLPLDKIRKFKQKLASFPKKNRIKWVRHKIKIGDSINSLAKKYKVDKKTIASINKLNNQKIIIGNYLLVPTASKQDKYYNLSQYMLEQKRLYAKKNGKKIIHTVKSGDSLWSIARKYDANMNNIVKWNNLASRTLLKIGDKLIIWQVKKTPVQELLNRVNTNLNIKRKIKYTARGGDNLFKIANKFKVSVANIQKWNDINDKQLLKIGQKLTINVNIINYK